MWGASTILLLIIAKSLKVNSKFAAFIFVITQMFYFGTMRNMFGFMMMYFSIVLIFSNDTTIKKSILIPLGAIGLYLSTFLHTSMAMYVGLLILALIPFGKKTMKLSLYAFPILYGMVFALSSWFVGIFFSSDLQSHSEIYTNSAIYIYFTSQSK